MDEEQKYLVYKDTSEKLGWNFPESPVCAGTVPKNLFTGDYSLVNHYEDFTFVIEKKASMAELSGNLTNKEKWDDFKDELGRLEQFRHPFVICDFPISCFDTFPANSGIPKHIWKRIRITPQFLMKRLQEIDLKFKTKFLFFDAPGLAQKYASGLFKRIIESYGHKNKL